MTVLKISTPAKTILFGEHAVVYGVPAIAVPINQLRTTITISPKIGSPSFDIDMIAPQIKIHSPLTALPKEHPFKIAFTKVLEYLQIQQYPACIVKINSEIPMASGLGSSAAVSVGLIKAFSQFSGAVLSPQVISDLAYQVEIAYHGTPSGIDNTVISFEKPVIFQKEQPLRFLTSQKTFSLLVTNSGIPGNTKEAVSGVRDRWNHEPETYNRIFDQIGEITQQAIKTIQNGSLDLLGNLMDENHYLLQNLGVSHPKIDQLVYTAKQNGALGSKLCGGGLGGNLVSLIKPEMTENITAAMIQAGAKDNYLTIIHGTEK